MAVVIGIRNEPRGDRHGGQHHGPAVQVGDRLLLAEPNPGHPVVEVVGVGRPGFAPVLQSLGDYETGVEERHGEDEQRHDQCHDRVRLQRTHYCHDA